MMFDPATGMFSLSPVAGFLLLLVFTGDMSSILLWIAGRKEQTAFRSRRGRMKKRHGQRWWAARIAAVTNALRIYLFYALIASLLHHSA